jgi:DnaJ-class molecular chaperone
MIKDYYKILNLSTKCTKEDIKKNYKQLALKWHPDRNKVNKEIAEEKFKEIAEAYEILIDDYKKYKYDNNNSSINHIFFNNPTDIFNRMNNFNKFVQFNTNFNNNYRSITTSKIYSKNKFGKKIIKTEIKTRLLNGVIKIEIKEEII